MAVRIIRGSMTVSELLREVKQARTRDEFHCDSQAVADLMLELLNSGSRYVPAQVLVADAIPSAHSN